MEALVRAVFTFSKALCCSSPQRHLILFRKSQVNGSANVANSAIKRLYQEAMPINLRSCFTVLGAGIHHQSRLRYAVANLLWPMQVLIESFRHNCYIVQITKDSLPHFWGYRLIDELLKRGRGSSKPEGRAFKLK